MVDDDDPRVPRWLFEELQRLAREFGPVAAGPIVAILGEQANRYLRPIRFPEIAQLTFRGVEPARLNGVEVFTWRPFEIARRVLAKPIGAPALAFAPPATTITAG